MWVSILIYLTIVMWNTSMSKSHFNCRKWNSDNNLIFADMNIMYAWNACVIDINAMIVFVMGNENKKSLLCCQKSDNNRNIFHSIRSTKWSVYSVSLWTPLPKNEYRRNRGMSTAYWLYLCHFIYEYSYKIHVHLTSLTVTTIQTNEIAVQKFSACIFDIKKAPLVLSSY